ncbi:hypothetical protein D3C87_1456940 [compost metagenome]
MPPVHALHVAHDPARQWTADDTGNGDCGHEDGDDTTTHACWKPIGEVQDDAGEEARFKSAEQEARDVKLHRRLHEHHGGGDQTPADHNPHDRLTRSDLSQEQVARDFEQDIACEENSSAQAVDSIAETEILLHAQRSKADVNAIQIGHDVAYEQQWQNFPCYPFVEIVSVCRWQGRRRGIVRCHSTSSQSRIVDELMAAQGYRPR